MGQRPNELTPHASPRHFWGAELRNLRTSNGLSLADLGRRLHVNASYLAKIERAERPVHPELASDCDRVLKTGGALVRLYALIESGDAREERDVSRPGQDVASSNGHVANTPVSMAAEEVSAAPLKSNGEITLPVRTPDGRIVYVPLSRRHFLQGLGATAAGIVTTPAANALASTAPSSNDQAAPIEHFQALRKTLADSDNLFGPRRVIATVREQINLMQDLRKSYRGTDLRDLLRVQTEYADLLGWLHQDSGDHPAAAFWLDRALEWAHMSADQDAVVFILSRKSQLAGDVGDGAEAIAAAEAGIRMSTPHSRLAAIATTQSIRGYALLGDEAGCSRAYDAARELLTGAQPDTLSWGQFFDTSYIDVHHAQSQVLLGNYQTAAEKYDNAIAAMPRGFRRDQGVYLAREALAYAGGKEAEHAANLAISALTIGAETGSGRILGELGQVHGALEPWQTVSAVRQFRDTYTDTLLQQS